MENTGLIGDILALLGVFFLGFVAGVLFAPVQRLLAGVVRGPKVLVKGAQAVSTRLLEALSSAEDRIDNSRVSQSLTNAVTGVLTIGLRQAEAAFAPAVSAAAAWPAALAFCRPCPTARRWRGISSPTVTQLRPRRRPRPWST